MTLKNHIGIYVFSLFIFYGFYFFRDDINNGYKWYIPFWSATIIFSIIEILGWSAWYFFLS